MLEKVEIIKRDGTKINLDLISEFSVNQNDNVKKFILLTANEIDQNGLIKLLASEITNGQLVKIASDDDWTLVKNIMRSIISGSAKDFTYTNTSDNMSFSVEDDYARIIAVQDAAKQALVKDYETNKPQVETPVEVTPTQSADPNASIYPTESVNAPIGSEIVPGIAETSATPVVEENVEPVPESTLEEEAQDITPAPVVEETPAVEEPAIEETPVVDAETPAESSQEEVAIETPTVEETTVEETAEEPAPIETPTVEEKVTEVDEEETEEVVEAARQQLIDDIMAAVDRYLASLPKKNNNTEELQTKISKMQEDLNQLNEAIQTQE